MSRTDTPADPPPSPPPSSPAAPPRRKRWPFVVGGVVVVLALVGAAVWWFVLRDTADPEADLDAIDTGAEGADGSSGEGPATPDGEWAVAPGESVFVGYRVDELFAGDSVSRTATGRTPAVTGTLTVEGDTVTAADVTADVTQLTSDQARRDSALATRGLETGEFPEASFTLAEPVTLPSAPERDTSVEATVSGDLTLHGVTAPVTLTVEARWDGPTISVAGRAPIAFADYGMEVVDIPGFVRTEDNGTMEFQLVFAPA